MTVDSAAVNVARLGRGGLREKTRLRLLEFGRRAFASKGLAATNLKDDILAPAGVSVGSFYHQFKDKTELFLVVLEEHSQTFRALVHQANAPKPSAASATIAHHSFATVFRIADENDDLFRIMSRERESHDPRVRQYLRDNHQKWITSLADDYRHLGIVPEESDKAELVAELIAALTMGTVLTYLDLDPPERLRRRAALIDGLVRFTIGGVMAIVTPQVEHSR